MQRLTILLFVILFTSCVDFDDANKPFDDVGMRPIYNNLGDDISKAAMQFNDLTNIVVYQELILAMENLIGIHIINNSDPVNPANTLFIPVTGLNDIAVKDDIVIANAGGTLYSIDISDRTKAILKSITFIEGANNDGQNMFPEGYNGLFECVDPEGGIVVAWELVEMNDSDCWR